MDPKIADGSQDDLIILVSTDEGIVGIGEVDSSPEIVRAVIDAPPSHANAMGLRHVLVGERIDDIGALWHQMYLASIYYGRRGPAVHAMSGIEMALWDIKGQAAGKPVHELLGTTYHNRLLAYASMLMPETVVGVEELVGGLVRDQGFRAVKLGWGPIGRDRDHDVRLVEAARRAAGDNVELMIDAGFGYRGDVPRAASFAHNLERLGVAWLEEPFEPDDYESYAALADDVAIPIAAGEHESTRWGFKELIDAAHVDIVQPDVTRCGGLAEAIRIAGLASDSGRQCVTHAWKTGVIKAASLQVNAVLSGAKYLEYCVADTPLARSLTVERFPLVDGYVEVPTKPGLGITLDRAVVARYAVTPVRTPIPV